MSRVFPSDDPKWAVRLSCGRTTRSKFPTSPEAVRQVVIQKTSTRKKHASEGLIDEVLKFIAESKRQIDAKARGTIEMVEKWQSDTCSRFDMIQQHIIKLHNPQIENDKTKPKSICLPSIPKPAVTNGVCSPVANLVDGKSVTSSEENYVTADDTESIVQANETPKFPSMPLIMGGLDGEDDFTAFMKSPIIPLPKKVNKRRNTDQNSLNEDTDFPVQKQSRPKHSSVLAMSTNSPKIVLQAPNDKSKVVQSPATSGVIDNHKIQEKTSTSNGKNVKPNKSTKDPEKSAIFQKFLETQRKVNERSKRKAIAAGLANGDKLGQAYPIHQ